MASSTSASSIQKSFKYDVFLSFRGEDTRKSFVDHLYHALQQRGINTYKDDEEIKKGKKISDELIRSIQDSKFYIIVFSKNYASSSWCLNELVKIMECCQNLIEHTAYPLFYDVEPTEVRKQSGTVGEAFAKHKEEEDVRKWRDALTEAADLAGWELKTTLGHEAKFIEKIVKEISLELRFVDLSVDGKLVGMETRVKDVVKSLETSIDDFRIIGIKGIGGGGKTTLARVVFDQISVRFEGSSFVENVREASKNPLCGLKFLQKQVLSDVLNKKDIKVTGVYEGKKMMKKMIRGRKVLVVLDDVDHIDQLQALVGESNWFKPGSRIIITTRDEQVLVAHEVPKNLILDVNMLSLEESTCLFNKYAFGRVIPNQGYDMLSKKVVRYAAGLPLSIKVLGALLRGKDEREWTDAIERLKTIPLVETTKILEMSYESLEEEHKKIFLDVACILKGWDREEAIRALECRGFRARIGLKVLELKSLISVSYTGHLGMHDHVEEMGKDIVRRLHPDDPSNHSRLWIEEEVEDVLVEDKGTKETRCIKVGNVDPVIIMKGLRKMKQLRFLYVTCERKFFNSVSDDGFFNYNDICEDNVYLPNGLQYLRWDSYPFKYLPQKFQANNLVGIKMDSGNIHQLSELGERKVLKKLRFIEMSSCKLKSLDIELIPNLERLCLAACHELEELHIRVKNSHLRYLDFYDSRLRTMDLEWAQNLDTLKVEGSMIDLRMPLESIKLKHVTLHCSMLNTLNGTRCLNLETLDLKCNDLVELYLPIEHLKSLKLSHSKIKTLNLTRAWNLEWLDLQKCEDILELHMPSESPNLKSINISCSKLRTLDLTRIHNLKWLKLEQCEDLVELHMPIENLLKSINISCSKLRTLDLTGTHNLECLELEQCEDLVELHMPIENLELKSIKIGCSKLTTLKLTGNPNLKRIYLKQCKSLVELDMPNESPFLETINIRRSKLRTLDLTGYRNLKWLDLEECEDLVELHMPIESPKLKSTRIFCSKLKTIKPTGSRNLNLDLRQCEHFVEFHMPVKSLELENTNVYCSKLGKLKVTGYGNLARLDLKQHKDLVDMPIENQILKTINIRCSRLITLDLTGFWNLEHLHLEQCEDLIELHMPIESLKLKSINLFCPKLTTLKLTGSRNLERLDLEQCENLVELQMPTECLNLESIIICCSKLTTLKLTGSRNLKEVHLVQCEHLVELYMPDESPQLESINVHCSKLRKLNLTGYRNLKGLDLKRCEDLVELYMPIKSPNLKAINIPRSKLRTLDLSGFENLEWLDLKQCEDLVELHMPIESPKLKSINILCPKLTTFTLTGSRNLEHLDLYQCKNLVELHMPTESLELKRINICSSKLRTLDLTRFQNLEWLYLKQCEDLVEFHMPTESPKLKSIKICCSKLKSLKLTGYRNLEELDLEQCEVLIKLHMPPESPQLKNIIIRNCSKLRTLHLGLSPSLERLDLHDCSNLVEIYVPVGCLSGFVRFKPFLINQGLPMVGSFDDLHLIARPLGICSLHPENNMPKFHFECIYKELLLSSTRNLAELITNFGNCACTNLASLSGIICGLQHLRKLTLEGDIPEVPKELEQLECLEELTLLSTNIEHLPDSICMLKHLKVLQLKSCWFLKQLPEDLDRLECLEELRITDFTSLREIPNSICNMKRLRCFHLINCILVEKFPKEMGRLKCLKELNIQGTGISDIPDSIFQMEDLRFFL